MKGSQALSRRDLVTGRLIAPEAEAHISSLVVHVRPEKVDATRVALAGIPGLEIHGEERGKFIVTLETETEADIVMRMGEISFLEGVMSAALVFHHCDPTGT
jgi:nitrate reductase NapD